MRRKTHTYLLLFFCALFVGACEQKQSSNIPYVYVNVKVDLNQPEFFDLRAPGNSIAIRDHVTTSTDGYAGILIVCASPTEYYAFDQCCTLNPELRHKVIPDGAKGVCEDCQSQFFLLDGFGTVLESPAKLPLLRYRVTKIGSELLITNYNRN